MIFGGALAWAHYKLRGGTRNIALTTGAYAALVVIAILLLTRNDPRNQRQILGVCTTVLTVLQGGILVLVGGSAVRNAIRKDLTSGMIQSHRLMPISGTEGVAGYILGSTSQAVCIAAANVAIGLFTTRAAGGSPVDWLLTNVILAVFSITAWSVIALLSFLTQPAMGLLTMLIIMAFATSGLIMLLLPALLVLTAPALSALTVIGGPPPRTALELFAPAQIALAAFCFAGAAHKFRRDDVLAFTPLLGLAMVALWATLTWMGMSASGKFFARAGGILGPGEDIPAEARIIASTLVGVIVGIIPVMASAWLSTLHHRRRLLRDVALDPRPLPPILTVLAVTAVLCTLPLYLIAGQMRAAGTGWTTAMSRDLACTAATIALNLLSICYLMRILYRVSHKSAILVGLFLFCSWVGPPALDFLRFGMAGFPHDDPVLTGISACGPVGVMILIWGSFKADVAVGLVVQAICAATLAVLFHATQQRRLPPEARAAALTLAGPRSGSGNPASASAGSGPHRNRHRLVTRQKKRRGIEATLKMTIHLTGPAVWLVILGSYEAVAAESNPVQRPAPTIGMWYTVWWTKDDQYRHWVNCHRLPVRGRYTAGAPEVIDAHYRQLRDLGVDFLIMDDTNCVGNDGGRINDNIRAWFDFMDAKPDGQRIPICIAGGGEMRGEGAKGQSRAADFYHANWAKRPSYFHLDGKPLLLVDTDDNYGPGDWDDPRFAVRWAYNGDNFESMASRKTWGWGSYEPAPILAESMSIWPGHRFPRYVAEQGCDPLEEPREGGRLYVRMWLRVLKARPRFVTVADYNNFEEETAIEPSYAWEDGRGHAVPDLYLRITRAYARLRTETPVPGEYYRDEDKPEIFLFDGKRFVYQGAMPRRATVILTPAGMLDRMQRHAAAGPTASQPETAQNRK